MKHLDAILRYSMYLCVSLCCLVVSGYLVQRMQTGRFDVKVISGNGYLITDTTTGETWGSDGKHLGRLASPSLVSP